MDYLGNDYACEFKTNREDSSPRLSDEHSYDDADGYAMLNRWQDRYYRKANAPA